MKLLVFDLDGTLADSILDITEGLNYALRKAGLSPFSVEETQKLVGHSVAYMVEHAVKMQKPIPWESLMPDFTAHYHEHCVDHTRPYDGIPETLQLLKKAGYTLAVVSNKPDIHSQRVIAKLFPENLFDFVLGRVDTIPTKPDPAPLRFCMKTLGADKSDTIYIGDSEVDVDFANNTGIPMVIVDWGNRTRKQLQAAGAQNLVSTPNELILTIKKILPLEAD